jgi:hypothetical protein
MMGLEPTTFCMANARDRSHLFAPVRSNRLFPAVPLRRANATEPERTPNLAILAMRVRRRGVAGPAQACGTHSSIALIGVHAASSPRPFSGA